MKHLTHTYWYAPATVVKARNSIINVANTVCANQFATDRHTHTHTNIPFDMRQYHILVEEVEKTVRRYRSVRLWMLKAISFPLIDVLVFTCYCDSILKINMKYICHELNSTICLPLIDVRPHNVCILRIYDV